MALNQPTVDYGAKLQRCRLAHFLDANFNSGSTDYVRLGKDLESFTTEYNPESESKKNILGETDFTFKGFSPSSEVETHYARESDPLFEKLKAIGEDRLGSEDDIKTTYLSIWMNKDGTIQEARREEVYIVVKNLGGDTSGITIAYEIHHTNIIDKGTYNPQTRTFTSSNRVVS